MVTDSFLEFDVRRSLTLDVLRALDGTLDALPTKFADGLDMLECANETIGIGCVALQAYIANTLKDLRGIFKTIPTVSDLLKQHSARVGQTDVSVAEAVWACANYYKHNDEWPDWNPQKRRKETIETLARLGITEKTEFRCVEVLRCVQGDNLHMTDLLDAIAAWREAWMRELQAGAAEPRVAADGAARRR